MTYKNVTETKVGNIFTYLRKQNWGIDSSLSRKECADVVAFSAMIDEVIQPAVLHLLWIDNDHYSNITGPWFTRHAVLPYKFVVSGRAHKEAKRKVFESQGTDNVTAADVETKIYKDAKDCLSNISQKLGDKNYFFGDQPCSLDALVFSYVAPLLKAPLNSNQLTNHLRIHCENLCFHTRRILREFFPLTAEEMAEKQKEEERKKAADSESKEGKIRNRDMLIAGAFALTAMTLYAFSSGLVNVKIFDAVDVEDNLLDA
ncbi:metaxin-3-like isoform X2 [Dreissena polymorpha]|nr:metaxin-3-like isoform X2 [Dreissena polymorpha]XP_052281983.1 metaxin-3-like isoform X2 [Dreissena polymorpha]